MNHPDLADGEGYTNNTNALAWRKPTATYAGDCGIMAGSSGSATFTISAAAVTAICGQLDQLGL